MDDGTPGKKPPAPSLSARGRPTLILRKAKAQSLIEGWNPTTWSENDYCVLDNERRVGRIYPGSHPGPAEVEVVPAGATGAGALCGHRRHAGERQGCVQEAIP